jgi:hypothetical protein
LQKVCFELEAVISVFIMHNKECFLNFEAAHNAFETGILASCRLLMTTLQNACLGNCSDEFDWSDERSRAMMALLFTYFSGERSCYFLPMLKNLDAMATNRLEIWLI